MSATLGPVPDGDAGAIAVRDDVGTKRAEFGTRSRPAGTGHARSMDEDRYERTARAAREARDAAADRAEEARERADSAGRRAQELISGPEPHREEEEEGQL